jgi:hypothetical protein
MKKRNFYILASILIAVSILSITAFPSEAGYDNRGNIKLTYRFEEPAIEKSGEYHRVEVPGLKTTQEIGKPKMPFKTARILLPHGTTYGDVKVTFPKMKPIEGEYLIEPAQDIYIQQEKEGAMCDSDIYSSANPYPANNFKVATIQVKRGYRILYINLYPVSYSPFDGKLQWADKVEVEVTIRSAEKAGCYRGMPKDRKLIARSIDNPEALVSYPLKTIYTKIRRGSKGQRSEPVWPPQNEATPVEYVIITSEALKNASGPYNFQALEAHREQNGLNATIITTEQIYDHYLPMGYDSQEQIRYFIRDIAGNEILDGKWGTEYIVLGGNCEIIPVRYFMYNDTVEAPADVYYGCLDGSFDDNGNGKYGEPNDGAGGGDVDLLHEVAVGRFTVADQTELSNVVRKTIAYENSTDEYLHRLVFSADINLGASAEWMEEIRWGSNSTNGFIKTPFFNKHETFYVIEDLLGDQMVDEINNNNTQIFNNACHGAPCIGMRIYTSRQAVPGKPDLSELTNTRPFFAYLQDCKPGQFDLQTDNQHLPEVYCFCEELINMEFGAFAAICFAQLGPEKFFCNEFWDAIVQEKVYEIGNAYNDSKEEFIPQINQSSFRYHFYGQHLFGDPAVKLKMNDIPLISGSGDFNGDGASETGIYRNNSGLWSIRDITRIYYGGKTDLPVNGDYDGDGLADIGIFRKTNGLWAVRGVTRVYYGGANDMPIPGDYNGDGLTDIAVYCPSSGEWKIKGLSSFYYGNHMDIPTVLDYDGDGADDPTIFRGTSGLWAVRGVTRVYFGTEEDLPIPADYDGDGCDEIAIFCPSSNLWAVRDVTRCYFGDVNTYYGMPVPADYDGNNQEDISIFRPTNGLWAVRGITRHYYGSYIDFPVFGPPGSPGGIWHMDEQYWDGTNDEVNDSTGNGNHGTAKNGATTTADGKIGRAGFFDGSNDYVEIPNSGSLQLDGDLTLSFWLNPNNIGSARLNPLDKSYGGEFALTIETNGRLSYYHGTRRQSGYYWGWAPFDAGTLVNGEWQLITITRDSSTNTMRSYLDGKLIKTTAYSTDPNKLPSSSNYPVKLARGYTNSSYGGVIDEVRICSRVLNEDEIWKDYEEGILVSCYKLDENEGTTAHDSSIHNNDGTIYGADWIDGILGHALDFDGINDHVEIPNSESLQLDGDLTLSFWLHPNNIGSGMLNPLDKSYGGEFALTIETNGLLHYYHGTNRQSGYYWGWAPFNAGTLVNGEWQLITITRDSSTNTMRSYLNGELVKTTAYSTDPNKIPSSSSYPVKIARGYTGSGYGGVIDEVKLYDIVLSDNEIKSLYGVVATWHMDEPYWNGTNDEVEDSSGNDNHGTAKNGATTTSDGKIDRAGIFDGDNDYIDCGDDNRLKTNNFTVSAWIYHSTSTGSGDAVIGNSKWWDAHFQEGYVMKFSGSDTLFYYVLGSSAGQTYTYTSIPINTWTHVAMSYDGEEFKAYKNGSLLNSLTATYTIPTNNLLIGKDTLLYENNYYFNGRIDEVKLFDRALSDEEIEDLYNVE